MPSTNERARWNTWYDNVMARMNRQKASLDRVVLLFTESMAALEEIAEDAKPGSFAKTRATQALRVIKAPAAASAVETAESVLAEEPVEDPRRNK
jgi:hypothetical protein